MPEQNGDDFPLEIRDVDAKTAKELMKLFTGEHTGFVRIGPKGYFMPEQYRRAARDIYRMPVRPGDVFVTSYPRSGTTWTQELVWMVANDLDYKKSLSIPLTERYTFLELSTFVHPVMAQKFVKENSYSDEKLKLLKEVIQPGTEKLAETPSPRFIKSHLPLSLLPVDALEKARLVYVARDPRDVAVSFYHLNRLIRTQGYIGDFKTYWNYFIKDLHHWTPYFEHLKEAWKQRRHPNMLFLFYEELSADLRGAIARVSGFFGKQFTEEETTGLCRHLDIANFRNQPAFNYDAIAELNILLKGEQSFIRKGKSGGWRDYFDEEMTQQADEWIARNLRDTDFRFPSD